MKGFYNLNYKKKKYQPKKIPVRLPPKKNLKKQNRTVCRVMPRVVAVNLDRFLMLPKTKWVMDVEDSADHVRRYILKN